MDKDTITKPTERNEQLPIPRKIYSETWRPSPQGGEVYLSNREATLQRNIRKNMATCKHESLVPLVRELYTQGHTKHQIAEIMGVRLSAVNYILYVILGVSSNNPRGNLVNEMPRELVNRVVTLACWGYTKKEIAEDLEVKEKLVGDLIKEATDKKIIQKFC